MELIKKFKEVFGQDPTLRACAPGRVNLIGEHTDYNDGFVMPIAIQYKVTIIASPRSDREIHLFSVDFNQKSQFALNSAIEKSEDAAWSNYERGVIVGLQKRGFQLSGANLLIQGNVPIGAGLSSSAAIEVATAMAMKGLNQLDIPMIDIVKLSQEAENQFVGMNCGIMDQFISGMGQKDHALFLDCRSLDYKQVPFPGDVFDVVIMNTNKKRELTGSEYNERRAQCEAGVSILQKYMPDIQALRDVSSEEFEKYKNDLPKLSQKRCAHVIYEDERTESFIEALKNLDKEQIGKLLLGSHMSLKNLFEVSCDELDIMVEIAMGVNGVIGARMTGAGFGGCAIAVVEKGRADALKTAVMEKYPQQTGIQPTVYVSEPSDGAGFEKF